MRTWALALLLAACSGRPYVPFDDGFEVHFILVAEGQALDVRPVCTVGSLVRKSPVRTLAPAAEVALIRTPRGDHRISVWEGRHHAGGRATVDVDRDLWIVMEVAKGERDARLEVFDKPPRWRLAEGWQPLVAVPH